MDRMERAFRMSVADVYPLYIQKVERKGRTKADVDEVTRWLTGFTQAELDAHLASGTTLRDFFADARVNPNASLITGVICGVRACRKIVDPLQRIRYLDKLVDEVARARRWRRSSAPDRTQAFGAVALPPGTPGRPW
ncbi:MAG: DUF2200 domain-containing protein [Microbacterium sp.]